MPPSSTSHERAADGAEVVTVVGAGLAGSMLALLLGKAGHHVRLLEKQPEDVAADAADDGEDAFSQVRNSRRRSINLALSQRGVSALQAAEVWRQVQELLLPMRGRCIHAPDASTTVQPYGQHHQAIFSVPRNSLNALLLRQLQRLDNVEIIFDCKVERVDPVSGDVHVKMGGGAGISTRLRSDVVIGADGAFSCVRDSLAKSTRLDFAQKFHHVGYREFTIPPTANGEFALADPENLHIWPRHNFMMIALPNADKTFTATLFLPWEGEPGLEHVDDADAMGAFLEQHMGDLVGLLPDLPQQMGSGCASPLLSVVCKPWASGRVLLLGDAAHAAVPFYGQGMNAAFEDALMLFDMWRSSSSSSSGGGKVSWPDLLRRFSEERQPAGEALVQLSLGNFREMSSLTARPWFMWKKRVDALLHRVAPSYWTPLYTLVSFSRTPYHKALQKARRQDRALAIAAFTAAAALIASAAVAAARMGRRLRCSH